MISLGVRDYLTDIFANVGTLWYVSKGAKTPTFALRTEQLESLRRSMLNHSIIARNAIAIASWITFEQHWWICNNVSTNVHFKAFACVKQFPVNSPNFLQDRQQITNFLRVDGKHLRN